MGLSMGLLGFAMFCQHVEYEFPGLTILPLVAIILYTFGFGAGRTTFHTNRILCLFVTFEFIVVIKLYLILYTKVIDLKIFIPFSVN